MRILVIEDDPVLGEVIEEYLAQYYDVVRTFDTQEAYERIEADRFDLIVSDINLPGENGIDFVKTIRTYDDTTPVIVVTAYDDTEHLKRSFEAGAHDYLKKPFDLEELRLRIEKSKTLFRIEQTHTVRLDETRTYHPDKKIVVCNATTYALKPKEAKILEYFLAHPHRIVSGDELIRNVWGYEATPTDATLRSYIRTLRQIVGHDKITTQRGLGYRYE